MDKIAAQRGKPRPEPEIDTGLDDKLTDFDTKLSSRTLLKPSHVIIETTIELRSLKDHFLQQKGSETQLLQDLQKEMQKLQERLQKQEDEATQLKNQNMFLEDQIKTLQERTHVICFIFQN